MTPLKTDWRAGETGHTAAHNEIARRINDRALNVRDFGARGSGDDTQAIQAAENAAELAGGCEVYFPKGKYNIDSISINGPGITWSGAGRDISVIQSTRGNLIDLGFQSAPHHFRCEHLRLKSGAGGGHIFNVGGHVVNCLFSDLSIVQQNAGKSIWWQDGVGSYISNLWTHIDATHAIGATVAAWHIRSLAANRNRWSDLQVLYSGNYTWLIESTAVSSYASDNTIEGLTGEVLDGGVVLLRGCQGTRLIDFGLYDFNAITKDMIRIETTTEGVPTRQLLIENIRRHAGALGAGLYDLNIAAGSLGHPGATLINCGGATKFYVGAGNKGVIVIGSSDVVVNDDSEAVYLG